MVRPLLESFWLSFVMPCPSCSTNNSFSVSRNSIPAIISSIQGNASSHASSSVLGISASRAPHPVISSASALSESTSDGVSSVASGMFTLPVFVPTFTPLLQASGNKRHFDLDGSLYCFSDGAVHSSPSSLAQSVQV